MTEFPEQLLDLAFCDGAGPDYNRASWDLRQRRGAGLLSIYELVLPVGRGWDDFKREVYPRLTQFLQSKRVPPEAPGQVVVTIFYRDCFHCLEAASFLEFYREREQLDAPAFQARLRSWLG